MKKPLWLSLSVWLDFSSYVSFSSNQIFSPSWLHGTPSITTILMIPYWSDVWWQYLIHDISHGMSVWSHVPCSWMSGHNRTLSLHTTTYQQCSILFNFLIGLWVDQYSGKIPVVVALESSFMSIICLLFAGNKCVLSVCMSVEWLCIWCGTVVYSLYIKCQLVKPLSWYVVYILLKMLNTITQ